MIITAMLIPTFIFRVIKISWKMRMTFRVIFTKLKTCFFKLKKFNSGISFRNYNSK